MPLLRYRHQPQYISFYYDVNHICECYDVAIFIIFRRFHGHGCLPSLMFFFSLRPCFSFATPPPPPHATPRLGCCRHTLGTRQPRQSGPLPATPIQWSVNRECVSLKDTAIRQNIAAAYTHITYMLHTCLLHTSLLEILYTHTRYITLLLFIIYAILFIDTPLLMLAAASRFY